MKRMLSLLIVLVSLAGVKSCAPPEAAQAQSILVGILGANSGATWQLIQHLNNFTCTTYACSITGVTTVANDLLIITSGIVTSTAAPTFGSVSGDGAWTHNASCNDGRLSTNYYYVDCAYRLAATGGAGQTFTYTWTANGGTAITQDIELYVVRRSTGTATFDNIAGNTSAGCTSCVGGSMTLTGTSDYIVQFGGFASTISALGAPWTNPADTDNTRFNSFNGALNQANGNAVTWTQGSSKVAVMSSIAFY